MEVEVLQVMKIKGNRNKLERVFSGLCVNLVGKKGSRPVEANVGEKE